MLVPAENVGLQQIGVRDLMLQPGHEKRAILRPFKNMQVKCHADGGDSFGGAPCPRGGHKLLVSITIFLRCGRPQFLSKRTGGGAVNRLAVDFQPLADLQQAFRFRWRNHTGRIRPHVEQVIPAFAGDVNQVAQQRLGGFEIVVVGFVAPGVIDRHARFPVAVRETGGGDVLLGCLRITLETAAQPVVIDDAGLEFEQRQDFLRPGRVHVHRRVKPEHGNGSIVAEKLADLRHGDVLNVIIHVMALQRVPPAARHRPAIVPILCLRVIKAEPDTFLLAGGGEVLERVVGVGCGLDDIPIAGFGIEHGKAVVMLGRDDDIFYAGGLGEFDPLDGIEIRRIEFLSIRLIFGHWYLAVIHDPFTNAVNPFALVCSSGHGINTPVDEQAKARFAPPSHARVVLLGSFVSVRCDGIVNGRVRRKDGFPAQKSCHQENATVEVQPGNK